MSSKLGMGVRSDFRMVLLLGSWIFASYSQARAVTPSGSGALGGKFPEPGARQLAHSPSGRWVLCGQAEPLGSDDFQVVGSEVYENGVLRYRVPEALGSGLYLSDNGWLAVVSYPLSGTRATACLYDSLGRKRLSTTVEPIRWAALSEDGRIFAVAELSRTQVLDARRMECQVLPAADRLRIAADGAILLLRGETVELWRGGKLRSRLDADGSEQCLRDAVWIPALNHFVLLQPRVVSAVDERGRVLWRRGCGQNERFLRIEVQDDRLVLSAWESPPEAPGRKFFLLNQRGELVEPPRFERVDLPVLAKMRGGGLSFVDRQGTIPWPLWPFDQARPIGNSYEEYQNYGGEPYLHPGVDILAQPHEPVFAVADGVVRAVLTISGQYHWRIAVGESAGEDTTEGWLYAHLVKESIAFDVGDTVRAGDYLGEIVPWPVAGFHHLHFVKVRQGGNIWTPDWEARFNPLEVIRPLADSTAPRFEPVGAAGRPGYFFYRENYSGDPLSPDSLFGDVDVIVRVSDYVGSDLWACSIYELRYWIESLPGGWPVWGPVLSARLSHPLPGYTGTPDMVRVLYSISGELASRGDYGQRTFYHIVSNSDGDSLLELSDADCALPCDQLPPGTYRICVEALDASGGRSVVADTVRIASRPTGVQARTTSAGGSPVELSVSRIPGAQLVRVAWRSDGASPVHLRLFDLRGRVVLDKLLPGFPGWNQFDWDGRDAAGYRVASGVYLCAVEVAGRRAVGRMLWMR